MMASSSPSSSHAPFPPELLPAMDISRFQNDEKQLEWLEPFTFIHAADTQFGLIEKYFLNKKEPGWKCEIKLTKAAITKINEMEPKVKFLLICGDMLDSRPGEPEERDIRTKQYKDFVELIQKDLDPEIKLVCVAGNHDICDEPTEETIDIYHQQFGPDYFDFWVGGVKFVVLNSQYFKSPTTIGAHFQNQLEFIKTIPDESAKHIVLFQHIPFFIHDPNEDDVVYLNIEKEFRQPLLEQLNDYGVGYVMCGHYHRNAGGRFKNIELTVTSALGGPLGNDPSGFRVVQVFEDKITHHYVSVNDFDENQNFAEDLDDESFIL